MTKILTSHVGSLPRTQDVVDFIFARDERREVGQSTDGGRQRAELIVTHVQVGEGA